MRRQRWQWGMLILAGLIVLSIGWPAWASSSLESRMNRLEFDLRRLRAQLHQLEASLGSNPPLATSPVGPSATAPILEEQWNNLVTLSVETKRNLQQLEQRVQRLEAAVNPAAASSSYPAAR